MSATSVRAAVPSELDALLDLQRRSSLVWEEYREQLLAHPEVIEVPAGALAAGQVRVAVRDGELVGFATVLPVSAAVGELDGLFIAPELMRGGLGRLLVEDAVSTARDQGMVRLEVTANPRALGFYEKVGFVTVGEVRTQFGPGIRMHQTLAT
jgi:GNAT superfamily N-acetyltransferase